MIDFREVDAETHQTAQSYEVLNAHDYADEICICVMKTRMNNSSSTDIQLLLIYN